jgi:hypothetical protein
MTPTERTAALNDLARTAMGVAGHLVQTSGIKARKDQSDIREKVEKFKASTPGNDPHGERDFGSFVQPDGQKILWKIDYYDKEMENGSEDPSDPSQTVRVLTIMLAEEY